jgi:hypothetical protein
MKRGYITINSAEGKVPSIEAHLVDGNLWVTKAELARIFGVYVRKIDAELCRIFKEQLLFEQDCSLCHRYIDKGIEKQTMYYNLEVLIFISYRVNSFQTKVFRQFATSALRKRLQNRKAPEEKVFWAYLPTQYSYCLN